MAIGPLELVVVGFDRPEFDGSVAAELANVVEEGAVRIVDFSVVYKDPTGDVTFVELADLSNEQVAPVAFIIEGLMGLLTEEDIEIVAEELPRDTGAMLVLFEHSWAANLRGAIKGAGGEMLMDVRIAADDVEALNEELGLA
jgi:uncharacterized membrane protein